MQIRYYSVYDKVADEFGPLFPHRNDNSAFRAYQVSLKDKNENEYDLYYICTFEDSKKTGSVNVQILDTASHIVLADREV